VASSTSYSGDRDHRSRRAGEAWNLVLLAVLGSVREFGRAVTALMDAPAGKIETFVEVEFPLGDGKVRPDGLIQVRRGNRTWSALVEVKTGRNGLQVPQVECYLDVARENGFDAVITISTELPTRGRSPSDRR